MWPSWEQTLIVFAAALLEGAVGFDFGLVAAPALGSLIGVLDAVVLLSIPNLSLAVSKILGVKIPPDPVRRLMPFIGAGGLGATAGVITLIATPPIVLKWGAGLLVLLIAAYSISRLRLQLDLRDESFFAYLAGLISGWLSGLTYAGGPLTIIYLDSLQMNRSRMAKMMNISALAFAATQVAAFTGTGYLPPLLAARSLLAVFPALAGFLIGRRIRGTFSPEMGYTAGLGLMTATALALLIFGRGVWK